MLNKELFKLLGNKKYVSFITIINLIVVLIDISITYFFDTDYLIKYSKVYTVK